MAGSVIDSLVVTLGLDSKEFAQGVKGSAEELAGFTRRIAGMFIAIRGIEDVVGYFKDLHQALAEVGFESRNLGIMGTEIERLGEVSKLFGGNMADAAESMQGLQASVFNLRFKGQISDSLVMLQRFGVAYLTATGHMRNFRDVAFDAARAIERQAQIAGLDKGERYQMALSFGFTGGIASAVAQGTQGFAKAYQDATADQKPLTERTIQSQTELARHLTRTAAQIDALNSVTLAKLTPLIEQAVLWMQRLAADLLPRVARAVEGLWNFLKNPPAWFKAVEDGIRELATVLGPTGTLIASLVALTAAVGIGSALVTGIMGLAAFLAPIAAAIGGGALLGKLIADLPSGGLLDKLNEKILDWLGPGSDLDLMHTPGAGTAHGVIPRPTAPPPTPTAPRPTAGAAGAPTAMLGGGRTTEVHIDTIEIVTQAKDADAIASGIDGALQRKLLVANSDGGQS